jgi:hypothetical protein
MFTKHSVTLAVLLVFGGASVAMAIEDPEGRVADRYPFLEKIDRSSAKPTAGIQRGVVRKNAKLDLYRNEEVENKIADRYPHLEQVMPPAVALHPVRVQQNAQLDLYINEAVENKIADRYPFLEQNTTIASAGTPARIIARTTSARNVPIRRVTRSVY